jgi:ParB-like chromosome segregation protein Spo0J
VTKTVRAAFEHETVTLKVDEILPTKNIDDTIKRQTKYLQIVASIKELGIIEPPVVHRQGKSAFTVLDGNARLSALRQLGIDTVECLVATDDENCALRSGCCAPSTALFGACRLYP